VWIVAKAMLEARIPRDQRFVDRQRPGVPWRCACNSGRSAEEILATPAGLHIADIGPGQALSPTRSNGLTALLGFINDTARAALA
jgi:hypothetical protein